MSSDNYSSDDMMDERPLASPPKVAAPPLKTKKGPQAIEDVYQKKTQHEHILLRPDTYIGSVEKTKEHMWLYNEETKKIELKEIEYVPGLYKIFDEILVNAADHKQRDKNMDCIKVEIDAERNVISVFNNGEGIPVVKHKDENMYVPTMIFGHLLTSSNYNDDEEKVTGGRNGFGAKLCNIYSKKFSVETGSKKYKHKFKQVWENNMLKANEPQIRDFSGEEYTKITFSPDLEKFGLTKLDEGMVGLLSRRAFDVAASTHGVKVFLNGTRIPIKTFKDYIDLYVKDLEDVQGKSLKIVHEQANERWEIGFTLSVNDRGFQQMSFVNSIATTKGGKHVDYVADMIAKQLADVVNKKNKGGVTIKPAQIKSHMWLFINCLIVNPTFSSQTKEYMTTLVKNFGSKCTLSEKFVTQVTKSGIVEQVLSWARFKQQNELQKKSAGKKQTKLKGIPKLEDANEAGTKNGYRCTLILTEGDSAKSLAVSGLGVIGRDYYGVFPLRGKLLNVREATHKQVMENAEINYLIRILGLRYNMKYTTEEDMRTLRYGKVMIMTDQDQDGSHIKGLVINFIHHNWPDLLKLNFLEEFITPIVKATRRKEVHSFYSLPEFNEWRLNTPNSNSFQIKYYKGLGTSTSKEAKEYFTNMDRHRIMFRYSGQTDDDHIVLAFSKKHVEQRKEWLTNFMVESKRRKEMGLTERYLYQKNTKYVSYADFVNLELVLFSNADNVRSIPSMVDGLKPGQRKVVFTCLKRNDKREVKVAQLAGSVAEMSAYHHGEQSLCSTIVNLAQNFVGSNNINILEPRGQFGTRLAGGKDSASPRYIFTKLSPLARLIFHQADDAVLDYEYDDNQKIEPVWYAPILPMVLVNGADGIGTGWMTKIPNFDPRAIVENLKRMIVGEEPKPLKPWYKNFKGTIEDCGDQRYVINGEISIVGNTKLEITELPVHTWTQNYKENVLEVLLHGTEKVKSMISDYREYNTDTTVRFVVTVTPDQLENLEKEGLHKVFKLQTMLSMGSMCAFDELGCLKKYESVMTVLREFYTVRLEMYKKRKQFLEGMFGAEVAKLSNQARFIVEKCSGKLTIENKKRKAMIEELINKGYQPDPVREWKIKVAEASANAADGPQDEEAQEEEGDTQEDDDDDDERPTSSKPKPSEKESDDVKKYDYLLGMPMWMLTEERKNELLRQRDNKVHELKILKDKSESDLWLEDLNIFMKTLDEVEEKERKDEQGETKAQKGKKTAGKRKVNLDETLPSADARRVEPIITEEMRKKIQAAIKVKENKTNKTSKKKGDDNGLESPDGVKSEPDSSEKKPSKKKPTDGLKQTKLNFKKVTKSEANGSPQKKRFLYGEFESASSGNDSDVEFVTIAKERTKRNVRKPVKYNLDSDFSDADEPKKKNDAFSDSDEDAPPPPMSTSEDLFDTLVGKKKDDVPEKPKPEKKKPTKVSEEEVDDILAKYNEPESKKKEAPKRSVSDSEDEVIRPKPNTKKRKPAYIDDESDSEAIISDDSDESYKEEKKTKKKKTVTKPPSKPKTAKGRAKKKKFDDSD